MGNKEIRNILLRRIVRQDEQFWMAAPPDMKFHFQGFRDGAGEVWMYGVTHLTRNYQTTEMEPAAAFAEAEKALYSMGLPMRLASIPGAKGCLYIPHWMAPVLLTIEQVGNGLQMTAYTGRSLLVSHFRCRIALWILKQRLPEGVIDTGKHKPQGEKAEKKKEPKAKETKEKETKEKEPKKQEPLKRAGKRAISQKKKKAAPKRLKK